MRKEIALVGCGMGTPGSLTVEGKCRIEEAEVLIGPERLIKPYSDSKKRDMGSVPGGTDPGDHRALSQTAVCGSPVRRYRILQ